MRPMRWQALLALPILALVGCRNHPPAHPKREAVLIFTPKVPGSLVVDTTGTEEAERLTMVVSVSADSVARYLRATIGRAGWQLMSDRTSGDLIDMYAKGGPVMNSTLWIHIERQDSASARYTLIANTPTMPGDTAPVRLLPPGGRPATPSTKAN